MARGDFSRIPVNSQNLQAWKDYAKELEQQTKALLEHIAELEEERDTLRDRLDDIREIVGPDRLLTLVEELARKHGIEVDDEVIEAPVEVVPEETAE